MGLSAQGWARFAGGPATLDWAAAVLPAAQAALHDPVLAEQYQCERTWFVGLDALPNDTSGRLGDGPPLTGAAVQAAKAFAGWPALHRAQLSVTFPGYPRPRSGESDGAFRYRLKRDAAHVDGVLGVGVRKRRFVQEPHRWVLGIGLVDSNPHAAPLVVWDGSHRIMGEMFRAALDGAEAPEKVDMTEAYISARARCFEVCKRVEVSLQMGEAALLHPMTLHGVAPWAGGEGARMTAYFRPEAVSIHQWLGSI